MNNQEALHHGRRVARKMPEREQSREEKILFTINTLAEETGGVPQEVTTGRPKTLATKDDTVAKSVHRLQTTATEPQSAEGPRLSLFYHCNHCLCSNEYRQICIFTSCQQLADGIENFIAPHCITIERRIYFIGIFSRTVMLKSLYFYWDTGIITIFGLGHTQKRLKNFIKGAPLKITMYNTPIIRQIIKFTCLAGLKLRGWKLEGAPPENPKYVLISFPHTSNWDFPLALSIAFVYGLDMHWMGKDSLFKGWRGPIMRWMGGIAINRASANNVVAQTIEAFNQSKRLVIAVPPEGTRSKVKKWKTGFYYIALGAELPIALAFLDYKRKTGGFLSTFHPTGDATADIEAIRAKYVGICAKNLSQSSLE